MTNTDIYCTYVTFYSGNKLPPFYIGSTSVEKIKLQYHGSVKSRRWKQIYHSELKNNPQLFNTEIINTFTNRQEALADELKLQQLNNVVKSPWFFNESFASVNGFFGSSMSGLHTYVDILGNKYHLKTDDPRIALDNLVSCVKGKLQYTKELRESRSSQFSGTAVYNVDGVRVRVPTDDPRVLSGELVHDNKNRRWNQKPEFYKMACYKDNSGKIIKCKTDDSRVLSGEYVGIAKGRKVTAETTAKRIATLRRNRSAIEDVVSDS